MSRRGSKEITYTHKHGSYGNFSTDLAIPIQYIMTTFSIDELIDLSFARDLQTDLNFDLLIQRDIDEERAVADISQYISPQDGSVEDKQIVFLPPLLAAVVHTSDGRTIDQYYPDENVTRGEDKDGNLFLRDWGGVFKLTHYEEKTGYPIILNFPEGQEEKNVDCSQVKLELAIGREDAPGARLVVVDGQHRLFAMKYLRKTNKDKVKHIMLPVCIVFSPNSTEKFQDKKYPPVPEVLRKLFVDVNSSVEKVSGHFLILLSDSTLGSSICRIFCDEVLKNDSYGNQALQLVEWNTKNYKQSKTISKPYTVTSIGVIADVLEDNFKTKDGVELLKYMLNFHSIPEEFDFGLDDNEEPKPQPKDFPWRDFGYKHKHILEDRVRDYIAPCLIELFFEIDGYKEVRKCYDESFNEVLIAEKNKRTKDSPMAAEIIDAIENFKPYNEKSKIYQEFCMDIQDRSRGRFLPLIRTNVFQKALVTGLLEYISKSRKFNVRVLDATKAYVKLINLALSRKIALFENDPSRQYLQDSVFDGVVIKPTKECRNQIKRLLNGLLADEGVVKEVVDVVGARDPGVDSENLTEYLKEHGYDEISLFNDSLFNQKVKLFKAEYKTNTTLTNEQREKLQDLQEQQLAAVRESRKDKSVEIPEEFDEMVMELVKPEWAAAKDQLDSVLGYQTGSKKYMERLEEDGEEEG